jgi:tellurium resistance protein TerD
VDLLIEEFEMSDNKHEKQIKCPMCSSTQLTANKKGFGLGKAAIGGILTGGIGLLGGFIGSGKVKITCLNCGNSWKAGKK